MSFIGSFSITFLIRPIASKIGSSFFFLELLGITNFSLTPDEDELDESTLSASGKLTRANDGSIASSGLHASRVFTMAYKLLRYLHRQNLAYLDEI